MGMREEFEAAWRQRYPDHDEIAFKRSHIEPDSYVATRVKDAWWAWQASRAALVIELPDWQCAADLHFATPVMDRDAVRAALTGVGVTVK